MSNILVIRYRYAPDALETLAYGGGITAGLKHHPWRALLIPSFLFSYWLAIRRLTNKRHFAAIHAHWILPCGWFAVATDIPTLVTAHGADVFALKGRISGALRHHTISRAKAITVVGSELLRQLIKAGAPSNKISVEPMGIDTLKTFIPASSNTTKNCKLLFVGRLVEKKGTHILLASLPPVIQQHPNIQLEIIGDGPERAYLQNQIESLNLTTNVIISGSRPYGEIPSYFQQADIAIFPSLTSQDGDAEGFGLVLIEAIACGCPCIASDIPSFREIADECESVQLFDAGDIQSLTRTILSALNDLQRLKSVCGSARDFVASRYEWTQIATRYSNKLRHIRTETTEVK